VGKKILLRGSHVIAEAAVRAGCRFYFGYPITPQNELTEYMANALASLSDGVFIQSESELAAINMVIGVSMTGRRVMTSSSSPGISLKQEGISYLSGQELPAVIINTMRGGPGLGNIAPAQGDYLQATRGGGHGDYRTIVLAPASGQELADLTRMAFEYADRYRMPVIILGDGMMSQMMEPVIFPDRWSRLYFQIQLTPNLFHKNHGFLMVQKGDRVGLSNLLYWIHLQWRNTIGSYLGNTK
jgi:2-oxoglutarate ferredoxin oxidoreductase subunit alpha